MLNWLGLGVALAAMAATALGCSKSEPRAVQVNTARGDDEAATGGPRTWADQLDETLFGTPVTASSASRREVRSGPANHPSAGSSQQQPRAESAAAGQAMALRLGRRAVEVLQAGDGERALMLAEEAYSVSPPEGRWPLQYLLGNLCLGLHRDGAAVRWYREALDDDQGPQRALLWSNLATAYLRLGQDEAAQDAARRSLTLKPHNPEAEKTLGLLNLRAGSTDEGVRRLKAVVEANPRIPEAQVALAEIEEKRGQREAAASRYQFLLSSLESGTISDPVFRWKNLFFPLQRSTQDELRKRIRHLKSKQATETKEE